MKQNSLSFSMPNSLQTSKHTMTATCHLGNHKSGQKKSREANGCSSFSEAALVGQSNTMKGRDQCSVTSRQHSPLGHCNCVQKGHAKCHRSACSISLQKHHLYSRPHLCNERACQFYSFNSLKATLMGLGFPGTEKGLAGMSQRPMGD